MEEFGQEGTIGGKNNLEAGELGEEGFRWRDGIRSDGKSKLWVLVFHFAKFCGTSGHEPWRCMK